MDKNISIVMQLLLDGLRSDEIVAYMETEYGLKEATIKKHITAANKSLQTEIKIDREYQVNVAMLRLNELYRLSKKKQDYRTCLAVHDKINILLGLNADETIKLDYDKPFAELFSMPKEMDVYKSNN